MSFSFEHPYKIAGEFRQNVAYFSMEYAIHQPLKTYAGGLGFLSGSHMRSAFELKQSVVGIGILWKYGYYDQVRKQDQTMDVLFEEKKYGFLVDTGIKFTIRVSRHDVWVSVFFLPPEIFSTAPLFLLSTDLPENDYLSRTICHKLYDANPETRIAAAILLGKGGARLLDILKWDPATYHLNESHALPLAFYLYDKFRNIGEVRRKLVFTNHTPEEAGNQKTNLALLDKMGFFCDIPITEIRAITGTTGDELDHTVSALRLARLANAVSKMHQQTLSSLWAEQKEICKIICITNAQNYQYWHEPALYQALKKGDVSAISRIKSEGKKALFEIVADQCGKIYDPRICTIVFAKRFTGYKRPDLLFHDQERFHRLVTNSSRPVQIIWAGKPFPLDYAGIGTFDHIVDVCKNYPNCSILAGYELTLSKKLKLGADLWLNTPRITHEASGTSGMTAAMNGAINLSIPDGWLPEFAKDKVNSFIIPASNHAEPDHVQDEKDAANLYDLLENEVLPMYYDYPQRWLEIVRNSMTNILPDFDSNRMAREYYELLYANQ